MAPLRRQIQFCQQEKHSSENNTNAMDLWQTAAVGHRGVPRLGGRSLSSASAAPRCELLGAVEPVPTSVQVYNACLFNRLRARGVAGSPKLDAVLEDEHVRAEVPANAEALDAAAQAPRADPSGSMRTHASSRVECEHRMTAEIRSMTDTQHLLSDAQAASVQRQYVKTVLLLRRGAELGDANACALLAKMFGFGVVRTNPVMHLFERDTPRGIAWTLLGLARAARSAARSDGSTSADLHLVDQALALLCTLVCAPDILGPVLLGKDVITASMEALLIVPRQYAFWEPRAEQQRIATQEAQEGDKRAADTIWTRICDEVDTVFALVCAAPAGDAVDDDASGTLRTSTLGYIAFLRAYMQMASAMRQPTDEHLQTARYAWQSFLQQVDSADCAAAMPRHRRVAMEAMQWIDQSPAVDAKAEAKADAFLARIATIFPFHVMRTVRRADTCMPSLVTKPRTSARLNSSGTGAQRQRTLETTATIASKAPALIAERTNASAHSASASAKASSKLRTFQATEPTRPPMRARAGSVAAISSAPVAGWFDENRPLGRKRTSSIVSVTPSLMFPGAPSKLGDTALDSAPASAQSTATMAQRETSSATSKLPELKARLRRQASSASIKAALHARNV